MKINLNNQTRIFSSEGEGVTVVYKLWCSYFITSRLVFRLLHAPRIETHVCSHFVSGTYETRIASSTKRMFIKNIIFGNYNL